MPANQCPHDLSYPWRSRQTRNGRRRCDPNVLLLGPPGAGPSRLARRLTAILPEMRVAQALDPTSLHRIAVLTGDRTACMTARLCRTPATSPGQIYLILSG
jgi:predicted ATPase with chaperone activity